MQGCLLQLACSSWQDHVSSPAYLLSSEHRFVTMAAAATLNILSKFITPLLEGRVCFDKGEMQIPIIAGRCFGNQ